MQIQLIQMYVLKLKKVKLKQQSKSLSHMQVELISPTITQRVTIVQATALPIILLEYTIL